MMHHLLTQPLDAAAKVNLITEFIGKTYYHNMVTHLLEAHFQRKVYQAVDREEVLNADRLNQFFRESLEAFWGDAVVINPGAELTWMRQPHYFMGLYSYTYSAGLTIGTHMGRAIAGGDSEAVTRWLDVLKAGGSQSAKELAAHAGVDIDSTAALVEAIDYIDQLLDQVESLQ